MGEEGYIPFFLYLNTQGSSSNGRAPDSKSDGWGFESLLPCHHEDYGNLKLSFAWINRRVRWRN